MRILPIIYLAVLLFFSTGTIEVLAQKESREDYLSQVKGLSLIYRGKIEKHYSYKYKGTYFAYQEDYVPGDVYYNQKLYTDVLMNLNSHTDQILVRLTESHLPVLLDKSLVDWFVLDGRKFINMQDGDYGGLTGGYYEVLDGDETILFKKIVKEYREDLVASGQDAKIEKVFDPVINYYLYRDGVSEKVSGKSTFVKFFKEDKKEINHIFREATRGERNDKDRLYKKVLEAVR